MFFGRELWVVLETERCPNLLNAVNHQLSTLFLDLSVISLALMRFQDFRWKNQVVNLAVYQSLGADFQFKFKAYKSLTGGQYLRNRSSLLTSIPTILFCRKIILLHQKGQKRFQKILLQTIHHFQTTPQMKNYIHKEKFIAQLNFFPLFFLFYFDNHSD